MRYTRPRVSYPAVSIQESLNDAAQFRREADRLFKLGIMGLEGRAEAEELFASVRSLAFELARRQSRSHPSIRQFVHPSVRSFASFTSFVHRADDDACERD